MKRFLNYLVVGFAVISMIGCDTNGEGFHIDEGAFRLYSPQHGIEIDLKSSADWHIDLSTNISYTYDLDKWWEESAFVRDKMKSVFDHIRAQSPHLLIESSYIYNCITEINITANKPLCGRNASEELSDLFEMHLRGIVFAYPYGEFVKFEDNPIVYELEEWTKGRYITQKCFYIVPKEAIMAEEIDPNIVFTISCTFDNGVTRSDTITLPKKK